MNNNEWPVHGRITGPLVMIGFGSIGKGMLHLLERHFEFDRSRFVVIDPNDADRALLDANGIRFVHAAVTRDGYPALYKHLSGFRDALIARESRGKFWWEAQIAANPEAYGRDAIIYQEIQFHPCYSVNEAGVLSNNKTFIIPSDDRYLLAVLNSPIMWWHNCRFLPHMKDEALSPMSFRMERLPIAPARPVGRRIPLDC